MLSQTEYKLLPSKFLGVSYSGTLSCLRKQMSIQPTAESLPIPRGSQAEFTVFTVSSQQNSMAALHCACSCLESILGSKQGLFEKQLEHFRTVLNYSLLEIKSSYLSEAYEDITIFNA